jgi:inosine-uridine nucleoside N-ribohydrolase
MTNLAVLLTVHSELIECIEEIVFMGGGVGIGNRSAVAEYNILCDRASYPHAPSARRLTSWVTSRGGSNRP